MSSTTSLNLKLIRRLLKYASPYAVIFYGVALGYVILSGLAILRPWMSKVAIDDYIVNRHLEGLIYFSLAMVGILLVEILGNFLSLYHANVLGQSIIRDIREKLFKKILSLKISFFDNSSVGTMVTRSVNDMERIGEIFSDSFFEIVSDLLKMLVIIVVMLFIDWQLTLVTFSVFPFLLYFTKLFQKGMKMAFTEVRGQVANLNSFVQERITGMKVVQLFQREEAEYESFKQINDKHRAAWLKTIWYNSIFFPITDLCSSVSIGLIAWYGSKSIATDRQLELGTIIMFIQLTQMLFRPLRQIADKFNNLQMGVVASNRVFNLLDEESAIETGGALEAPAFKGLISFENVCFEYVTGQPVLRDMSFSIMPGETIALVGSTGAGKSTIGSLINRFYDIKSGRITIDGEDISQFRLESLRSQIAVVQQDVLLFADTILNNISLKNPAISEEEVIRASKEIGLYDFIMSLPGGFQYNVRERGHMLSTGQRQLISFLRAYVSNPSILILDEATSSVDTHSEELIKQATEKITRGRTSIIIAHRLSTVKKASKIFVLEAGTIVEEDNHEELLKIPNGRYQKLYELQFKEEAYAY